VTFYQTLYAWAPPCPPRGLCFQTPLLAVQTSSATSAVDGIVSIVPASIAGVSTSLARFSHIGEIQHPNHLCRVAPGAIEPLSI